MISAIGAGRTSGPDCRRRSPDAWMPSSAKPLRRTGRRPGWPAPNRGPRRRSRHRRCGRRRPMLDAAPMFCTLTVFCTASTRFCIIMPMPRPTIAMIRADEPAGWCRGRSVPSSPKPTTSRTAPPTTKGFHLPKRVISCPEPTEATSMPATIGMVSTPAIGRGVAARGLEVLAEEGGGTEHADTDGDGGDDGQSGGALGDDLAAG